MHSWIRLIGFKYLPNCFVIECKISYFKLSMHQFPFCKWRKIITCTLSSCCIKWAKTHYAIYIECLLLILSMILLQIHCLLTNKQSWCTGKSTLPKDHLPICFLLPKQKMYNLVKSALHVSYHKGWNSAEPAAVGVWPELVGSAKLSKIFFFSPGISLFWTLHS